MSDPRSIAQHADIQASLDALKAELTSAHDRKRRFHQIASRELLAIDTSVVAAYAGLVKTTDRESVRLIEALLLASDQPFTLLSPTVMEIQRIYAHLASQLVPPEPLPADPTCPDGLIDLRQRALHYTNAATKVARITNALARLSALATAPNLVASPTPRDQRVLDQITHEVYAGLLACVERPYLPLLSELLVDATCIAMAHGLTVEGATTSWITASQRDLRWAQGAVSLGGVAAAECVMDPGSAALSVGFRKVGITSLEGLIAHVVRAKTAFSNAVDQSSAEPHSVDLVRLLEQVRNWSAAKEESEAITSRWDELWMPLPLGNSPHELEVLAARANDATVYARAQLVHSFAQLGAALGLVEFPLLGAAAMGSKLTFEKLILYSETKVANTFNINQVGNNQSIIIDSFNTASRDYAAGDEKIASLLEEFLQQVQKSSLAQQDKNDVIEVAASTIADVAKNGKLKGAAKLAWIGTRDVLAAVPGLVSLWEKISELLS